MYEIQQCPFVQHHVEYRAALWITDGVLCYKCFSDDCDGENKKTGGDFVELVDPEPLLALADELRLARHVRATHSRNGVPTLRYFRGSWYLWDGCWQVLDEDSFTSRLYGICKEYILKNYPKYAVDNSGIPKPAPRLGKSQVANVILALKSLISLSDVGWIDGRGGKWIAFADQLLDLDAWVAGTVNCVRQTPEYFSPTALPYSLKFTDEEPTVLLEKLNDQMSESEVAVLQEFGGYAMTDETAIQRILYLVGPPRSMKGTYERVVRASVGEHNTVSKTFPSFLGAHALENVPEKTFMAISDSRPDPKLSKQAVERLLSISGEDPQDINPKGKPPYTAKLVCKIGIASNIMADFADPTGALQSRFLFVETTKSYAANPDPTLLDKILTQQNEITWWFLRGLRRLLANGRYTEPTNELRGRFELQNNPLPSFVAAKCNVTGKISDRMVKDDLYEAFEAFCIDAQIASMDKNVFFRELYAVYPTVKGHEKQVSGIMMLSS
jgi:putative DNA primase/helicase